METIIPAVVVAAYNRPEALSRLLHSLSVSQYENEITLVISIDKSDNNKCRLVAEKFEWAHGPKNIIVHAANLGLKKHILFLGDLTTTYGSIILLEDDIYVSPWYYSYATQSLAFYKDDPQIAGISLYNHIYNESAKYPFVSLSDNSDAYFLQLASSWGQIWTRKQWQQFILWKDQDIDPGKVPGVPPYVANWSAKSWKKLYIAYMVQEHKYFVYPKVSLSTNFSDAGGENHTHESTVLQSAMMIFPKKYVFNNISDSSTIYDSFCELEPRCIRQLAPQLEVSDFTVDLYGTKPLAEATTRFAFTSHRQPAFIKSYGLKLKPVELNILHNIKGDDIFLVEVLRSKKNNFGVRKPDSFAYHYRVPSFKELFSLLKIKLAFHFKSIF